MQLYKLQTAALAADENVDFDAVVDMTAITAMGR
jgi:hypothetical protein